MSRMMPLPEDTAYIAASAAGGVAAAVVNKSADGRGRKIAEGLVGALVAIFCGPSIAHSVGAAEPRDVITVGFVTAACGYGMLTAMIDWAKGARVRDWAARFIGSPPKRPATP